MHRLPRPASRACGALMMNRSVVQICPVDCVVDEWTTWSACSVSCNGPGSSLRARAVVVAQDGAGLSCPATSQELSNCGAGACPVDCAMSAWSSWGACSATCDGGTASQTRAVATQPMHGGRECGATAKTSACATLSCPVVCIVTPWAPWNACSALCAGTSTLCISIHQPCALCAWSSRRLKAPKKSNNTQQH